jgi:hypothetical protein
MFAAVEDLARRQGHNDLRSYGFVTSESAVRMFFGRQGIGDDGGYRRGGGTIGEPTTLDQFPYEQVAAWLQEGSIIPFVGAGASRVGAAEPVLPDGRGLADQLTRKMGEAFPRGEPVDLAKVSQFFEHTVFDRDALYEFLHDLFEHRQKDNMPGTVARMLAGMPREDAPLFLVTTNYDSFLERAFRAAGKPVCVITQNMRDPDGGSTKVRLTLPDGTTETEASSEFQWYDSTRFPSNCAFLFKMHGSAHRRRGPDDLIVTEDDYIDFMVNTGGSSSPYFPPASLTAAYKQRRFLFLGYSLYDWNFRAFLRMLALRNALSGRQARRHWAIQYRPPSIEVDLWQQRNVTVYDGDLADFCTKIESYWPGHAR